MQYGVWYKESKFASESKKVYLQGSLKKGCLAHIILQLIFYLFCALSFIPFIYPKIKSKK